MRMNLLSAAMRRIGDTIEKNTVAKAKITADATVRLLVERTPVDTTEAVSNWQLTINSPADRVNPPFVPGKGGSTATASRLIATTTALSVLEGYTRSDQEIFITNPAPYISELNDGKSNQAPAGFIEEAINEGQKASSAIRLLRRGLF